MKPPASPAPSLDVALARWRRAGTRGGLASRGGDAGGVWEFARRAVLLRTQPSIFEVPTIGRLWPLGGPLSPPTRFGLTVAGRPLVSLSLRRRGGFYLALAAATVWAWVRWPVAGFLGVMFFLVLAPTTLLPGVTQVMVEHRMYVPLAAVLALAVQGFGRVALAAGLVLAVRRAG